jgi:HK97 family phage major capsid protein
MTLEELEAKRALKMKRLEEIRTMDTLTDEIRTERDRLLTEVKALEWDIQKRKNFSTDTPPGGAGGGLESRGDGKPRPAFGPNDKKDYRSLFGANPENAYEWTDKETNFFQAVYSGRHHPGLKTHFESRAMNEMTSSAGGFLVPTEYAERIHAVALENEIVFPRAMVVPMISDEKRLPALEIGDHSSNLYGGFTASYTAEEGTISEANPKARAMVLTARKLTGFLKLSNELFDDAQGDSINQVIDICGKGLAWYRDQAFLTGVGAGKPLGILNADCTVEVSKETDQAADTIVYENLVNMVGRLYPGSFTRSVWVAHPTAVPALLTCSIDIGTGGSLYQVLKESSGQFSIFGRPVVFSEKVSPLGDKGDLMLADFSQYVIGLRYGMRLDFSPHVYFTTDHLSARLIERHDGMPLWDEALTLADGSTTVSPFVVLAARE